MGWAVSIYSMETICDYFWLSTSKIEYLQKTEIWTKNSMWPRNSTVQMQLQTMADKDEHAALSTVIID